MFNPSSIHIFTFPVDPAVNFFAGHGFRLAGLDVVLLAEDFQPLDVVRALGDDFRRAANLAAGDLDAVQIQIAVKIPIALDVPFFGIRALDGLDVLAQRTEDFQPGGCFVEVGHIKEFDVGDAFINKLTDGEGVNVIFEAAGVPALLAHATSQLSPAGRLVAMTFGKEPIPVNFKEINAKELTILGTRHQYQKFPEVVKILPDHLKEVDEITTHVFKAEDFQKAFDTLADRNSGAGKVVLTFA